MGNDTEEVCGVGGVPFDAPAPGTQQLEAATGPSEAPKNPDKAIREPNYLKNVVRTLKSRYTPEGKAIVPVGAIIHDIRAGNYIVHLMDLKARTFNENRPGDLDAMQRYIRDGGAAITGDLHDATPAQFYAGYAAENGFREAAPAWRGLAVGVSQVFGNNEAAAHALDALRTVSNISRYSELATKMRSWRQVPMNEKGKILAELPDEVLAMTPAGKLLNARKWAWSGMFDWRMVLQDMKDKYHVPLDMQELENLQMLIPTGGTSGSGPLASLYKQYRGFLQDGKKIGLTPGMVGRYMLMLHHPERVALVKAARDRAVASGAGMDELARFEMDNPTGFKGGVQGMEEFRKSLTPEQATQLAGFAKIVKETSALVNKQLLDAQIISPDEYHERLFGTPYWLPLVSLERNRTNPKSMKSPLGRYTEPGDVMASYWEWTDSMARAANINIYHTALQKFFGSSLFGERFPINLHRDLAPDQEPSPAERGVTTADKEGIYIYRLERQPNGAVQVKTDRLSFSDTVEGRQLRDGLSPQKQPSFISNIQNSRVRDFLGSVMGFNRFFSVMHTLGTTAWWFKTMAMNMGVSPFAYQSAFKEAGHTLDTATATRDLFGLDGRSGFLANMPRMLTAAFNPKSANRFWVDVFHQRGAGSVVDERFPAMKLSRLLEGDTVTLKDMLTGKASAAGAYGYANRVAQGILHFQHSPDMMVQMAGFKTFIEGRAGRTFENADDLNRYLDDPANRDVLLSAVNGTRRLLPNFTQRGGSVTTLRQFFPFFNASIQTFPYLMQLMGTRYGQVGAGLMLAAGYGMRQLYENETGDSTSDLAGEDRSLYLGDMASAPADYLWQPFLRAGANMYHMAHGTMSFKDAMVGKHGVMQSMLDAFSPVSVPEAREDGPNVGWTMAITPTLLHAPIMAWMGVDAYGNPLWADSVTSADHHQILNAPDADNVRPNTDLLSNTLARGLRAVSFGWADFAPGTISPLLKEWLPILPNATNAISGVTSAQAGRTPSVMNTFQDLFTPGFRGQTAPTFGGQDEFNEAFRNATAHALPAGTDATAQNLLQMGTPEARRAVQLRQQVRSQADAVRINGMTYSDINSALADTLRRGELTYHNALLIMQNQVRAKRNGLYEQAADQLRN